MSKLTLIYNIVVQGYLNIVRGVKTIEQIAVSEENTLLFRSVRSVVCYIGKRVGDGVVVRAYLKNVLAADVFVGNGIENIELSSLIMPFMLSIHCPYPHIERPPF